MTLNIDDFWRVYVTRQRAYASHLIPGDARHDTTAMALCGRKPSAGDTWRGSDGRVEWKKAYERPVCTDCLVVLDKVIGNTTTHHRRSEFDEPPWCMRCGRDRICDGEFEWDTTLDGWRHRWRFCPEDRRYERDCLAIPAIAISE